MNLMFLSIIALTSLIPLIILSYRRFPKRDGYFWGMLILAIIGTTVLVLLRQSTGWKTGLSTALWLTVLSCLVLYFIVTIFSKDSWLLTPILMPYLFILGILATLWTDAPDQQLERIGPILWIGTHILVSVTTYGLVTLAAVAALAASVQERALKQKRRNPLSRRLPAVTFSEKLVLQLLCAGEAILAIGLITGMASQYFSQGKLLIFDHKTIFTISVFVVIGSLLLANHYSGTRGKTITNIVLLAYLLLTLGYPGVKLVTGIILT